MSLGVAVLNSTGSHNAANTSGYVNSVSGELTTPSGAVALIGIDTYNCSVGGHGITTLTSGGSTILQDKGHPVAIENSVAGCGAIVQGAFASYLTVSG